MKNIKSLICTLLFPIFAIQAQTGINKVVKLKNGSEIRGEITESSPEKIKLLGRDGNVHVFQRSEIDTVMHYKPALVASRFYNRTTIGVLSGSQASITASFVNGYSFNKRFNLGAGIGTEYYNGAQHLSYFADFQYNLSQGRNMPFLALDLGASEPIRWTEFNKGGAFASLQVGLIHYSTSYFGLTSSVGYRCSILEYRNSWWDDYLTKARYGQLEIRFGITFK